MTPHVLTRSGMLVPLNQPTAEHIRLGDIAHALARIPRFNGHTIEPWSVADHSRLVARLLPDDVGPTLRLAALLHDGHEAYLGDITSPVAEALRRGADGDAAEPHRGHEIASRESFHRHPHRWRTTEASTPFSARRVRALFMSSSCPYGPTRTR
jgi:5'-deoxynucleotidase YfbR-like HD superfamily hydrolase